MKKTKLKEDRFYSEPTIIDREPVPSPAPPVIIAPVSAHHTNVPQASLVRKMRNGGFVRQRK